MNSAGCALEESRLIISTDAGGDPDDAFTLALAAVTEPRLKLVLTTDEFRDLRRAKFARYLLNLLGRDDVLVAAGRGRAGSKYWAAAGLTPADTPIWWVDPYIAVANVCGFDSSASAEPVRWLGIGPMTDLAYLLTRDANNAYSMGLAHRLHITQMGGAINYRNPYRAEHNFRLDAAAVHQVVPRAENLTLVLSDHTFNGATEIDEGSPIYQLLAASDKPWAQLLIAHMQQWFSGFHPATMMHDPLALSVVLGLGFVSLLDRQFHLAADARMSLGPGYTAKLSVGADYPRFMSWIHATLRTGKPKRLPDFERSFETLRAVYNPMSPGSLITLDWALPGPLSDEQPDAVPRQDARVSGRDPEPPAGSC
ncbi:nucleoside hydrolase [Nocardia sp. XZ_19_369]|uniref:nucleoside hydrolase n=1 Tax=Nocardia sp. XZ_19_369 TaxID=2769487 RepID=UPI00188EF1AC|nr:nucleoside hydrolase [Nocardia sp. XZ_19_369]